ncbi:hypothetical protein CCAX7_003310 [Capsulimonas corticalis]|uniref:Uncharacterized protein n=1 Tax=Capsulimonas corticalis TaxID=2219043 RepID=A0A402CS72_9BACT|nr:multicopper oxidase domain-containing protein [Capsulimonas corticalis]BDI28280.1 hypothetical protein CCAX7_003310 [Capsulimonas corticalis]
MPSRRDFLKQAALSGAAAMLGSLPQAEASGDAPLALPAGRTLEYWIQADSLPWILAPNGRDSMTGAAYDAAQSSFVTVGYRAYSENWAALLPPDPGIGENSGIPGPILRARVGDTIVIHFKNNDVRPKPAAHSIHLEGLVREMENDGFWRSSEPNLPGTAVYPGETYTYRYTAPASAAGAWLYSDFSASRRMKGRGFDIRIYRDVPVYTRAKPQEPSELDAPVGAQFGLFGMAIIDDENTKPADRENVVIFHDLYSDDLPMLVQDFDCINGRSFLGNTPTFQARTGERVRWRIGSVGRENHVFHIHGHRWRMNGAFTDTHLLAPGTTATFDYLEDSPGEWLYHCHFTEHIMGGMAGLYVVS